MQILLILINSAKRTIFSIPLLGVLLVYYGIDIAVAKPPSRNSAPVAVEDTFNVYKNTVNNTLDVLANDYDPDGDRLTITSVSMIDNGGKVAINSARDALVYTPVSDFVGTNTFTYTITDDRPRPHRLSSTATVSVTVTEKINSTPIAQPDFVETNKNTPLEIDVLANDRGLNNVPITVSIPQSSSNGSAVVKSDNRITYSPNTDYVGEDSFFYKVTDAKANTALASVTIQINCPDCITDVTLALALSWDPNPESVQGYTVYYGSTPDTTTYQLSDLSISSGLFDPNAPAIEYNITTDLELRPGDQACFRIKAYDGTVQSDFSNPICAVI
jgi:hypothetical protein